VQSKVQIAEQTERDIDATRSQYIPVAVNTQILFFCVSDLSNIDPMYQYSLEWFITIFLNGIANAATSGTVVQIFVAKFCSRELFIGGREWGWGIFHRNFLSDEF